MFDAVICDWDGTLADTRRAVVTSFQKTLRQIGCKVDDMFIERKMGIGAKNTFKEALNSQNFSFNDTMIEKLVEKKIDMQIQLIGMVNLFDGAVEVLDSLQTLVRIALASMNNKKVIDRMLDEKNVRKYFDLVLTSDEVVHPKPHPEILLKCAAKLECRPEKCVVIEDSIFGLQAAKRAKMKSIAVPTGAYSGQELGKISPDLIIDSMKEKKKILDFIIGAHVVE